MTTLHDFATENPPEYKSAGDQHQASPGPNVARPQSAEQQQPDHLIRFSRDFSEATSSAPSSLVPESLSSASSFQSLASTLSSKSSSGICADSAPGSPEKVIAGFDNSYVNVDIPELDDLINACAGINLNSAAAAACGVTFVEENSPNESADLSQDQTFASAADDTIADETQVNVEESLQTFKTCPALEATQVSKVESSNDVFKVPYPVDKSSVIPYVSFEDSVLKQQHQVEGEDGEFKSAQTSFQIPPTSPQPHNKRESYSPTPCVEIDVAEAVKGLSEGKANADASSVDAPVNESAAEAKEQEEKQDAVEEHAQSFEELQPLDSTIILNSETLAESSLPVEKALEQLNLTDTKLVEDSVSLPTEDLNQKEENHQTTSNKSESIVQEVNEHFTPSNEQVSVEKEVEITKESDLIVQETKTADNNEEHVLQNSYILNNTEVIEQEENNLNKTQDIVHVDKSTNKTDVTKQGNNILNVTQDILPLEDVVIKTEVVSPDTNTLNKTHDIVTLENSPIKDEVIVHESNLNKTHDIIKLDNCVKENEAIVQEINLLNKTHVIEDQLISNNTAITPNNTPTKTKNLSEREIVLQENALNDTELVQNFSEENILAEKTEDPLKRSCEIFTENSQNTQLSSGSVPLNTNKEEIDKEVNYKALIETTKSPVVNDINVKKEIKTPNKLEEYINYPNHCEKFITEESQPSALLNTEVIASTPLPAKNISTENISKTPRSKGALFSQESTSLKTQGPDVFIQGTNTPIKTEADIEEENNQINADYNVAANKSLDKCPLNASELITNKANLDATTNILQEVASNTIAPQEPDYEAFKPQKQSTTLPFPNRCEFEALQEAALSVAKDIDASLEKIEESEQFVSATTELFADPSAFDYLTQVGSQTSQRGERYDSLYMKFDPLAQRQSMLPQKNLPTSPSVDEEEVKEIKVDTPISNLDTPKKNPALAAIDRLLFYSPCAPSSTDSEVAEAKQKKEVVEKQEPPPPPPPVPVVDEKMAKELELVRSTVLQLEAELEKQKQEHKEQSEIQKLAYEEKINHLQAKLNQMQTQLTQEVKCKDQMTVVVEEYEKSISRLIAEREKDRTSFETEKAKLQEELQVANQHLSNTEAAFSDVHSKYERLKNVVSAYKSNETVLKESISENQETIKTLEHRYEQLKGHAMAQLEKANLELSSIRKHNEAETMKLKALVRKAELKSKSLEETVEQKIKENKELTQIIDEMIARVD